jgi:hypothetical protein
MPPMVFAALLSDVVEEACRYLNGRQITAYPHTTGKPVAVLGARYRWAPAAGILKRQQRAVAAVS